MDFSIITHGLPSAAIDAKPGKAYSFQFTWHDRQPGWVLTIPRHQTGQSEFSANHTEQEAWITALCTRKPWLTEVWFVTWQLADWRRLAQILEPLRSSRPPQHGLAEALARYPGDEAYARSLQLCRQFPDDAQVLLWRARSAVTAQRTKAAQRAITKLLTRWPDLADGHMLASELYDGQRAYARAVAARWRATALDSTHIEGFSHLLVKRQREAPAQESLASWERLEALRAANGHPPDAYALANKASCRWTLGDADGARADLDRSLALDPDSAWAQKLRVHMSGTG